MLYTADFETTTQETDCRVWAWAVCEIGKPNYFRFGNSIDSFIEFMKNSNNSTFYFHNLKFDGEFLMCYLFEHGFKHVTDKKHEADNTFSTLISDKGQFYTMRIVFKKQGHHSNVVTIIDSLKIIPFSVAEVAKAFNLPISKLDLDYTTFRAVGHILTTKEIEYIHNDVSIMAQALDVLFKQNLTKMTQGSNALYDYQNTVGEKNFKSWFPMPDYDADVRQSYKGGFTYLNPKYKDKEVQGGIVLDVNSLYPWVMHDCPLPFGEGLYFDGKYKPDKVYNLYVQMITCEFELKEGYIPTIQIKNSLSFIPTQYLESSAGEEVTLCLTSVDLELFLEHYNVYNLVYHSGWKFKSTVGLFTEYIDKWSAVKIESKKNGNKGMYTLAKLMLNALYGKFALNPKVCSKIPFYDNGVVKYTKGEEDYRDPLYIPVGTFITAWARHKTITSAQKLYEKFMYADTDSLHLDLQLPDSLKDLSNKELENLTTEELKNHGLDIPDDFIISPTELGAWKLEEKFERGKYIRQKCYIHDWNKKETWNSENYDKSLLHITCAGMPKSCYQYVTWENFKIGTEFKGKLRPKHVKGGIVLTDTEFTIL